MKVVAFRDLVIVCMKFDSILKKWLPTKWIEIRSLQQIPPWALKPERIMCIVEFEAEPPWLQAQEPVWIVQEAMA